MSFEQKYLKYKSKYLALKSQLNIHNESLQKGGSIYNNNLDDIDSFSQTSNLMSQYSSYLSGGKSKKSASDKSASDKSASDKSASDKSRKEDEDSDKDEIKDDDSDEDEIKDDVSDEDDIEHEVEEDTELSGGYKYSKVKSNKKYFFNDSEVNLDSTTTDSELSSLDSDSTDDSDL